MLPKGFFSFLLRRGRTEIDDFGPLPGRTRPRGGGGGGRPPGPGKKTKKPKIFEGKNLKAYTCCRAILIGPYLLQGPLSKEVTPLLNLFF